METHFSPQQLADPVLAEAEAILRRCVHCGLCTATCPTYVLLGDERDSPRGRIYLIKDMLESGRRPTAEVRRHLDRCLSCLSCMTTCPSGVDYMHLIDHARAYVEKTARRPLKERFARRLLRRVAPHPRRFRFALRLALLGKPFGGLLRTLRLKELAAMIRMAPGRFPKAAKARRGDAAGAAMPAIAARGSAQGRVILHAGCAQAVLRPQINEAAIRLLSSQGVEVVVPEGQGCCGALTHHLGQEEEALAFARQNIEVWEQVIAGGAVAAILVTASGCGTAVKDYGHMLAHDPDFAARAKRISALAKDVAEFLADGIDLSGPEGWSDIRVAYHSACSMQHGQGVNDEPRRLLREAGFTVVEIPEGHICCGSAGAYNILQPEIAGELRERKLANIRSVKADCVATGNIGCLTHLSGPGAPPIVHTVELLNWAYGGACPAEIAHLAGRVRLLHASFARQPMVATR